MVPPPIHTHQHHKHCIWKTFSFPVFYFFLWFWIYSLLNTYSVRICFQYWRINFPPTFTHSSVVCVCFWFVLKFKWQKFFFCFFFGSITTQTYYKIGFFFSTLVFCPCGSKQGEKKFFLLTKHYMMIFPVWQFFFIGPQRCTRWWWWWWIDFFSRSNYYQKHMHTHTHINRQFS